MDGRLRVTLRKSYAEPASPSPSSSSSGSSLDGDLKGVDDSLTSAPPPPPPPPPPEPQAGTSTAPQPLSSSFRAPQKGKKRRPALTGEKLDAQRAKNRVKQANYRARITSTIVDLRAEKDSLRALVGVLQNKVADLENDLAVLRSQRNEIETGDAERMLEAAVGTNGRQATEGKGLRLAGGRVAKKVVQSPSRHASTFSGPSGPPPTRPTHQLPTPSTPAYDSFTSEPPDRSADHHPAGSQPVFRTQRRLPLPSSWAGRAPAPLRPTPPANHSHSPYAPPPPPFFDPLQPHSPLPALQRHLQTPYSLAPPPHFRREDFLDISPDATYGGPLLHSSSFVPPDYALQQHPYGMSPRPPALLSPSVPLSSSLGLHLGPPAHVYAAQQPSYFLADLPPFAPLHEIAEGSSQPGTPGALQVKLEEGDEGAMLWGIEPSSESPSPGQDERV